MTIRFTLFNGITLFILLITVLMAIARLRRPLNTNWAAVYYAVIAAYSFAFDGSLNHWWLLAGILLAAVQRFGLAKGAPLAVVRGLEMLFFGYVMLRSVELVLMWPW